MVFRMLAVLAEFERDQISERTTMALAHKKARGERVGSVAIRGLPRCTTGTSHRCGPSPLAACSCSRWRRSARRRSWM
jgi:hypothetical protein